MLTAYNNFEIILQTDRQTDRQTDIQTDRQTDRQTFSVFFCYAPKYKSYI